MQLGEREDFSNLCGIAKVEHEGEEIFVAFADYMEFDCYGTVVGKGYTEIEALRMAFVNMCKNLEKLSNEFEDFKQKLDKLHLSKDPLNFDEEPIISIEGCNDYWDQEINQYVIKNTGKFYNADLIMIDGKACLGTN